VWDDNNNEGNELLIGAMTLCAPGDFFTVRWKNV